MYVHLEFRQQASTKDTYFGRHQHIEGLSERGFRTRRKFSLELSWRSSKLSTVHPSQVRLRITSGESYADTSSSSGVCDIPLPTSLSRESTLFCLFSQRVHDCD